MSNSSHFEKLLLALEEPTVNLCQIKDLLYFLCDDKYKPLFEIYIARRVSEGIHPTQLLNIAYHVEQLEQTHNLGVLLNKRMAALYFWRDIGHDHLYYMIRHDTRTERHILNDFIKDLSNRLPSEIRRIIKNISPHIMVDEHTLLIKVIDTTTDFMNTRRLQLLDSLDMEGQFGLWAKALEINSPVFNHFSSLTSKSMVNYIGDRLAKNGDDDVFAKALASTQIPITRMEFCFQLNNILSVYGKSIPKTLERLFCKAEQEKRYEYLLILGSNKNKKDLLRSIVKSKDTELIDKFFFLYKEYPEVKHLTPFL